MLSLQKGIAKNGENVVSFERNNKMQKCRNLYKKKKQKNYVKNLKAIKLVNESEVRKSSLPQPEFSRRNLPEVASRRIPKSVVCESEVSLENPGTRNRIGAPNLLLERFSF